MARTAKQGAVDLQAAARAKLEESQQATRRAEKETDSSLKLELLLQARTMADGAAELSEAANDLAKKRRFT